jgi:hypothetical protein
MFGPMKYLYEEEDFHPMKNSLARCKNWLKGQPKIFSDGIRDL